MSLGHALQQINVDNFDILRGLIISSDLDLLNDVYHVHAFHHPPKHSVLTIQPGCGNCGDEELAAVGVGACRNTATTDAISRCWVAISLCIRLQIQQMYHDVAAIHAVAVVSN